MATNRSLKQKICLVGPGGVGKTSLIKRYVFDRFSDGYIATIGTKITRKEIRIKHPTTGEDIDVKMLVWDIMGQLGFRELLQEAYFFGAQGAIAVCDVTRKGTLYELEEWIQSLYSVAKKVPIIFIGNKCDLADDAELTFEDVKKFASNYDDTSVLLSSAKTGINVNLAFKTIAEKVTEKMVEGEAQQEEVSE